MSFLAGACGPQLKYPPASPLELLPSPELYELTAEVAALINAAAGVPVVIMATGTTPPTYVVRHEPTDSHCGYYGWSIREIGIGNCGRDFEVLTHEIGHALGLEHVADPRSIMAERVHAMGRREAVESLIRELEAQSR